jgi:hypothetical protein
MPIVVKSGIISLLVTSGPFPGCTASAVPVALPLTDSSTASTAVTSGPFHGCTATAVLVALPLTDSSTTSTAVTSGPFHGCTATAVPVALPLTDSSTASTDSTVQHAATDSVWLTQRKSFLVQAVPDNATGKVFFLPNKETQTNHPTSEIQVQGALKQLQGAPTVCVPTQ